MRVGGWGRGRLRLLCVCRVVQILHNLLRFDGCAQQMIPWLVAVCGQSLCQMAHELKMRPDAGMQVTSLIRGELRHDVIVGDSLQSRLDAEVGNDYLPGGGGAAAVHFGAFGAGELRCRRGLSC